MVLRKQDLYVLFIAIKESCIVFRPFQWAELRYIYILYIYIFFFLNRNFTNITILSFSLLLKILSSHTVRIGSEEADVFTNLVY